MRKTIIVSVALLGAAATALFAWFAAVDIFGVPSSEPGVLLLMTHGFWAAVVGTLAALGVRCETEGRFRRLATWAVIMNAGAVAGIIVSRVISGFCGYLD